MSEFSKSLRQNLIKNEFLIDYIKYVLLYYYYMKKRFQVRTIIIKQSLKYIALKVQKSKENRIRLKMRPKDCVKTTSFSSLILLAQTLNDHECISQASNL